MTMFTDLKQFLMRGNLVELAVAFVIGAVFAALVKAFIADLITFATTAAVVFFFIVKPYNMLMARRAQEDPTSKECPECTSTFRSWLGAARCARPN